MAAPAPEHEYDFWEFVGCAVCHLPFAPPDRGPPPVPFWVTECGHVLCNAHLNPDQSCAKCGDRAIQLVPLQRNIDPPIADWFRSLPHAIDSIANAVKFQQESVAALARHYRNQCLQLSSTCDRLRNERKSLKKENEALRRELILYRGDSDPRDPSAHLNHNGKRPMVDVRGQNSSAKSNSSPRSIQTPVGPLRLTLPPGEHPTFTRQETSDRPGSSRFAEQFAYHEEGASRPPQPSGGQQPTSLRQPRFDGMMAPPPPPNPEKRFKPASNQTYPQADLRTQASRKVANISESMGPPPTPQRPFSVALRTPARTPTQMPQTNRFVPGSSRGRTVATPAAAGKALGGNRMPFVPQGSNGFG